MRQNYAIIGIVVLGLVTLVTFPSALNHTQSSRQRLMWGVAAVALAMLVSVGVFDQLIDATAASR